MSIIHTLDGVECDRDQQMKKQGVRNPQNLNAVLQLLSLRGGDKNIFFGPNTRNNELLTHLKTFFILLHKLIWCHFTKAKSFANLSSVA